MKYNDVSEFHLKQWKAAFKANKPIAAEHHKALYLRYNELCEIPLDDLTFYHIDESEAKENNLNLN